MADADRLLSVEISKIVAWGDVVNREIDPDAVAELVDSIRDCGLNTPIRVRPISKYKSGVRTDAWELIAGQHRLEAVKVLGWTHIDANAEDTDDITAEMAMIDENLKRTDLDPPYRIYATSRRKELYELLHPEAVNGGDRRSSDRHNGELKPDRFTKATAKATGRAERSIQRDAQIGKTLGKETLKTSGTSLGNVTELEALANKDMPASVRDDLISRAAGGEKVSAKAYLAAKTPPRRQGLPRAVAPNEPTPEPEPSKANTIPVAEATEAAKQQWLAEMNALLDRAPKDWCDELILGRIEPLPARCRFRALNCPDRPAITTDCAIESDTSQRTEDTRLLCNRSSADNRALQNGTTQTLQP